MLRVPGGLRVIGWASDPDPGTVSVQVTVDGAVAGSVPANQPSPGHGNTGFDGVVPALPGDAVCATALTVGPGVDAKLGCIVVDIPFAPGDQRVAQPRTRAGPRDVGGPTPQPPRPRQIMARWIEPRAVSTGPIVRPPGADC